MQRGKNVTSQQLVKISGQLNYVLSNSGMILALQGQGHSTHITEIEKK